MKPWLSTVAISIAFVVVLVFAWLFMDGMIGVLRHGSRIQGVSSSTNAVRQAAVIMNVSGIDNKVERGDLSVVAAYDSLSTELSSWMSIMGIFATVFGVLIPIGSYLLQRLSLKDEREGMMKEISEKSERSRNALLAIIDNTKRELSLGVMDRMKPMWNFLASNFDRFLINDVSTIMNSMRTGKVLPLDVANFLIGLDIYLDCLVRAANAGMIAEATHKYCTVIDDIRGDRILWQKVVDILRVKIQPSPAFVTGDAFAKLIGVGTWQYEWLKSLYDEVIPWKFGK